MNVYRCTFAKTGEITAVEFLSDKLLQEVFETQCIGYEFKILGFTNNPSKHIEFCYPNDFAGCPEILVTADSVIAAAVIASNIYSNIWGIRFGGQL